MCYADEIGLYRVARRMREFAVDGDAFWQPAELIVRLLANCASLAGANSMNAGSIA